MLKYLLSVCNASKSMCLAVTDRTVLVPESFLRRRTQLWEVWLIGFWIRLHR